VADPGAEVLVCTRLGSADRRQGAPTLVDHRLDNHWAAHYCFRPVAEAGAEAATAVAAPAHFEFAELDRPHVSSRRTAKMFGEQAARVLPASHSTRQAEAPGPALKQRSEKRAGR
jgi:hypothetical protein